MIHCKFCYTSNTVLHVFSCNEYEEISFLHTGYIQSRIISIYFAFHNAWDYDLRILMKYANLSYNSLFWMFGHLSLLPSLQSPNLYSLNNFPKVFFHECWNFYNSVCCSWIICLPNQCLAISGPSGMIGYWILASPVCCLWPSNQLWNIFILPWSVGFMCACFRETKSEKIYLNLNLVAFWPYRRNVRGLMLTWEMTFCNTLD